MTTRIGILGGSFDPPHYGHLRPALEAMEQLALEAVFFLPSGAHPLKDTNRATDVAHRVAMTRLAIQEQSGFELCELDANRPGISYTVDTLRILNERFPLGELIFLMGSDLLAEVHRWKNWPEIMHWAHIGLLERPGHAVTKAEQQVLERLQHYQVAAPQMLQRQHLGRFGYCHLPVTAMEISSRNLRHRLRRQQSIRYLTPEAVITYIKQHNLYGEHE
ncbi:nicotinate-nucleotide adenylyltransferase [Candidatus Magnetaquicoccus inordinatus]|uniref:nicotinate-nucleotide adenylyltransferase n=1 Tax=Candidatus Magnetaquicoccus inordinatus TaxID=2496818 RepID=UPI00102CA53C|nr:nicotinate-nucleotide adenylyltransferase [Candidatus Magnetaquicoccus inordinatus]